MSEVVRYELDKGSVLVEVDEDSFGIEEVARGDDEILDVGKRLDKALEGVSSAAQATLKTLSQLGPETLELEFGVKLAGQAGAIIAKTSTEAHFTVTMTWSKKAHP